MGDDADMKNCQGLGLDGGMGKSKSLGEKIKEPESGDKANSDESCGQWCLGRLDMQRSWLVGWAVWHSSSESIRGLKLIYLLAISFTQFIVRTPEVAPLCKTAHVSLLHVAEFDQASIFPISLDGLYMYAYYTLQ
jgi:hypothetical protein